MVKDSKIYHTKEIDTPIIPTDLFRNPKYFERSTKTANSDDLRALLKKYRVTPTEEILKPPTAWEQVLPGGRGTPIGTLGNFSLFIGKAKSRKTFLVTVAVAATLKEEKVLDQIRGCLPEGKKKVLYFDTEQGRYHVQLAVKRICRQIGQPNPKNLHVFGLRPLSPNERFDLINYAIENSEGVGLVVIDGIRDLVTSINDEEEATKAVTALMKWSEEKGIHIIAVLHQNKNDSNARGHLGTESVNKAETTLSITVDPRERHISEVQPEYSRGIDIEPFAFEIIDGLPVAAKIRTLNTRGKMDLEDAPGDEIESLLANAFGVKRGLMQSDLIAAIRSEAKDIYGERANISEGKLKAFVKWCLHNNYLSQEKDRAPYRLKSEVPF